MLKRLKIKIILRVLRSFKILVHSNKKNKSYEILNDLMNFKKFTNKNNFLDRFFLEI